MDGVRLDGANFRRSSWPRAELEGCDLTDFGALGIAVDDELPD